jgi:hypothetical protein
MYLNNLHFEFAETTLGFQTRKQNDTWVQAWALWVAKAIRVFGVSMQQYHTIVCSNDLNLGDMDVNWQSFIIGIQ